MKNELNLTQVAEDAATFGAQKILHGYNLAFYQNKILLRDNNKNIDGIWNAKTEKPESGNLATAKPYLYSHLLDLINKYNLRDTYGVPDFVRKDTKFIQ